MVDFVQVTPELSKYTQATQKIHVCLLAKNAKPFNCVMTNTTPTQIIMIVGDSKVRAMYILFANAGETISVGCFCSSHPAPWALQVVWVFLHWVFGLGFFVDGVQGLLCGAFWVFLGWGSLYERITREKLCLIHLCNRSVSKLQIPFITYTERKITRKTLPWLGFRLSLGLRGQSIFKRSRFPKGALNFNDDDQSTKICSRKHVLIKPASISIAEVVYQVRHRCCMCYNVCTHKRPCDIRV